MRDYLQPLLSTGALAPGSFLSSDDPHYSCVLRDDGKLEVSNWPVALRTLQAATRAAQELIEYGTDVGARNIKTLNPLFFWTYFDDVSNKQEKLSRLWQLHLSSRVSPTRYCQFCIEAASASNDAAGRDDVISILDAKTSGLVIAPRQHFTDIKRMPARDTKRLTDTVLIEVRRRLLLHEQVTVKRICGESGHVAYSVHLARQSP
jgi:hypothetical protein